MAKESTKHALARSPRSIDVPLNSIPSEGSADHIPAKDVSFPFMKLPAELRVMVYKYHLFQAAEHPSGPCCAVVPGECASGGRVCRHGTVNQGVQPGNLWIASKTIYYEAMPVYFGSCLQFSSIENLGKFFITIPNYYRQYITKVNLCFTKTTKTIRSTKIDHFAVGQAFRLLSECPNLIEIGMSISQDEMKGLQVRMEGRELGLENLLEETRGIKKLNIKQPYATEEWLKEKWQSRMVAEVEKRLSVLKEPYTRTELKRRKARGITKKIVPRTCFDGSEKESRAARYERRSRLKEIDS
ncbi:MAG: hypothetical protein Q9168_007989 [Polycauliona sp. 1 TL-2023]